MDTISYNAAISDCAKRGSCVEALALLSRMAKNSIEMNTMT